MALINQFAFFFIEGNRFNITYVLRYYVILKNKMNGAMPTIVNFKSFSNLSDTSATSASNTLERYAITFSTSSGVNKTRFVILESAVSIFTLILIYVIVAFFAYEWKKPTSSYRTLKRKTKLMDQNLRYGIAMRIELMVALTFLLGRFAIEQFELVTQYLGAQIDYCNGIIKVKIVLTTINVAGVYMFLWTRQRFCYAKPAMQHLSTATTRITSWVSLILLFSAHFVGTLLFLTTRSFTLTPVGCDAYKTTNVPLAAAWVWVAVVSFCFQVLLTALFVYPLIKHKAMIGGRSGFSSFIPLVKRTTTTAVICIVTDLASSLLILIARDAYQIIPTLIYDISAMTNVVCILVSYRDWRQQIFSPFICYSNNEHCKRRESSTQTHDTHPSFVTKR